MPVNVRHHVYQRLASHHAHEMIGTGIVRHIHEMCANDEFCTSQFADLPVEVRVVDLGCDLLPHPI